MKLLFDHNISYKLVERIGRLFPASQHVRNLNLHAVDDRVIWEYACDNNFTIVSKDQDFHQLSFLFGAPPKVVWLRIGNCTTYDIEKTLKQYHNSLIEFESDKESSFIIVGESPA